MKPIVFMKNVLFFALPACVLLTGCTPAKQETAFQPKLDPSYTVHASMEYGDSQQADLSMTRYQSGLWDATFSEPSALSGVVLSFDGNAVSASYKGLAFTVPKSALPAKNMLLFVTDVLDSLEGLENLPCAQQDDGTWCSSGESEGGSYTITFSPDGALAAFDLPSQPLKLTFSEYVCNGETGTPGTDTSETTEAADGTEETAETTENSTETEGTS